MLIDGFVCVREFSCAATLCINIADDGMLRRKQRSQIDQMTLNERLPATPVDNQAYDIMNICIVATCAPGDHATLHRFRFCTRSNHWQHCL
jgi:hypothetical protein